MSVATFGDHFHVHLSLLLLAEGEGTWAGIAEPVGWGFAWWGIVLYWVAGILYAVQLRQLVAGRRAVAA